MVHTRDIARDTTTKGQTMKLTATAKNNLKTIWTSKTAAGATDRRSSYRITRKQAAQAGYGWMNSNASYSLVSKGLARVLITKDTVGTTGALVEVLVLTDLGRAQIGV